MAMDACLKTWEAYLTLGQHISSRAGGSISDAFASCWSCSILLASPHCAHSDSNCMRKPIQLHVQLRGSDREMHQNAKRSFHCVVVVVISFNSSGAMSLEWVEDMLGLTTWHGHVCEGQLDSVRELFGYETRLLRGLRRNKAMKDMEEAIRDAGARVGISLLTDLSQNLARVQTTQCAEAASSASSSEDEDGDGVSASLDAFTDDVDYVL